MLAICEKSQLYHCLLSHTYQLWYASTPITAASFYFSTGVSSYKVDLETKMVMICGDILPLEVLESVSKVKTAELWNSPC